jgi:hypothetical protein
MLATTFVWRKKICRGGGGYQKRKSRGSTVRYRIVLLYTCERAVSFPSFFRFLLSSNVVVPEGERRWYTEVVMVALPNTTTC